MKRLIILLILVVAIFTLVSCSDCEHNWISLNCEEGRTCSICGDTNTDVLQHSWKNATCSSAKVCTVCSASEGEPIEHTWVKATCERTAYCSICNKTTGTPSGHSWINECLKKQVCSVCDKEGELINHDWKDATCTTPKTCALCKATEGEPTEHDWVETTCREPKICSGCNAYSYKDYNHKWVFVSCTTPRVCMVCARHDTSAPGHKWIDATCTTTKYCDVCDEEDGEPNGHRWVDASCDNPKTCTACGLTDGKALGHDWSLALESAPSCAEGIKIYTCVCGKEQIIKSNPIYEYHICDLNGYCSTCDTTYNTANMVLESLSVSQSTSVTKEGIFTSKDCVSKIKKQITTQELGMPIIELNGDISQASKTKVVTVNFYYDSESYIFDCNAEVKVQGASSAGYPKKNYSIKLVNADGTKHKEKIVDDWGRQHKYCLKANYVDFSQARNVVSAKIFGDIIRSRNTVDELTGLPNGGAIDGYPVVVYNEGAYLGLYTMNIPKDKWMFGMDDSDEKNQAILMADQWNDCVAFRVPISSYNLAPSGWELEFASNEESPVDNNTNWVVDSMNQLINFVINNDGKDFVNGISKYADVDKCIDSMIYTFFICADDNISKNILWVTYDGTKWFSSVYDMDGTWGMQWNGALVFDENTHLISNLANNNNNRYNLLWEKLYINCYDRIVKRYNELRAGPLSIENITTQFESFFDKIPTLVYEAEKEKWTGVPSQNSNSLYQILEYARKRIEKMDKTLI